MQCKFCPEPATYTTTPTGGLMANAPEDKPVSVCTDHVERVL